MKQTFLCIPNKNREYINRVFIETPQWICPSHLKLAFCLYLLNYKNLRTHVADWFQSNFLFGRHKMCLFQVQNACGFVTEKNWRKARECCFIPLWKWGSKNTKTFSKHIESKGFCCDTVLAVISFWSEHFFQPNRRNYNHLKLKHQKQNHSFFLNRSVCSFSTCYYNNQIIVFFLLFTSECVCCVNFVLLLSCCCFNKIVVFSYETEK